MTFQVALIGSDGLIVGSDRKTVYRSPNQYITRGRSLQFNSDTKFATKEDNSIVCFYAGGPQSSSIANAILTKADSSLDEHQWHYSLEEIAASVPGNSVDDEVLVVRKSNPKFVSLLTRYNQIASSCKIEDKICTGVPLTARFITEHLWERRPVAELQSLALLVLASAAVEHPSAVGRGFDLMTLRERSIVFERYEENDPQVIAICNRFKRATLDAIYGLH